MTPPARNDRAELEALLPFHVNDTLDPEARARIDLWLAEDAEAAGEAAMLAQARRGLQADPVQSPGEIGLARLMRSLDAEAEVAAGADAGADAARQDGPAGAAGGPPAGMPKPANLPSRPVVWQAVAAVALVALIGQNVLTWGGVDDQVNGASFGLAGGLDVPATLRAPAAAITVAFAPGAAEAEIRALLLELEAEIVAGPSALGLYRITVDDPEAALARLRAAPSLVDSAERIAD